MNEFICNDFSFSLGKKTYIMGILNVTPDSFSDGGKYNTLSGALMHAENMIKEGADIIDIGAVSTRPFSEKVSAEEEWSRLEKILPEIKRNFSVPVSVDTFIPSVAEKCLDFGADIINDVSGVFSSDMAEIIKKYNCGWIVMHGGVGVRKTEDITDFSDGIINDVNRFFSDAVKYAEEKGISLNRLCLDAGFGFSKTNEQNLELLKNYEKLEKHSLPLLCALSRKRFIGELSGEEESSDRLFGTLSANITAVMKGADIVRVHDVLSHKKSLSVTDRLLR